MVEVFSIVTKSAALSITMLKKRAGETGSVIGRGGKSGKILKKTRMVVEGGVGGAATKRMVVVEGEGSNDGYIR